MSQHRTTRVIEHLRRAGILDEGDSRSDAELLTLYLSEGKTDAFTCIVQKYGPMVWNICHRMLKNRADIEDAFQATFLVLVRKARSLKSPDLLGNWLYGVAVSVARRVRLQTYQKQKHETPTDYLNQIALTEISTTDSLAEFVPLLDQALTSLPEKYRLPIVLCDLQGLARRDVAQQLAIPEGTVASRHARGRALLAKKLRKHGIGLGILAALLEQGVSSAKLPNTVIYSTLQMIGQTTEALKTLRINQITNGVISQMGFHKLKALALASVALVCVAIGALSLNGSAEIVGQVTPDPITPKTPEPKKEEPKKETPKPEEPKNKLDPDIVRAWMAAGSIPGWMGSLPNGLIEFRQYPDGLTNPIPAFKFQSGSKFAFDKLPAPKSAFGLDFSGLMLLDINFKKLIPFENIQHLELTGTHISSDSIKELIKFPNLQSVGLKGKRNIREEDSPLLAKIPKLRVLDLRNTPLLAKEYGSLKDAKNLQVLCIGGIDTKKDIWAEIKGCKKLTHLIVREVPTDSETWKHIAELKKLEYFESNGGAAFAFEKDPRNLLIMVEHLSKLPELHSLVVRDMVITFEQANYLKDFKKLKHFEFIVSSDYTQKLEQYDPKQRKEYPPTIFKNIDQVKTLESICFNRLHPYYFDLKTVWKTSNLEVVEIRVTDWKESYRLYDLSDLKESNVKKFIYTPFFVNDLKAFQNLPKIESLELTLSFFNKETIDNLEVLKNLQTISIDCVKHETIQELTKLTQVRSMILSSRSDSRITEPLVDEFGKEVKRTPLKDESLKHLVNLKNLRYLEIRDTDVTEKGIEELRKALPDCRIVRN